MIVRDETSLISGYSWTGEAAPGPLVLSYSFDTVAAGYLSQRPEFSAADLATYRGFDQTDRFWAREALQRWSEVSGVRFVEAAPGTGDIRFGKMFFGPTSVLGPYQALSFFPARALYATTCSEMPCGGDVFVNTRWGNSYFVMLHEIGHALSLKHPFVGDTILDPSLDNQANTVMSYNGTRPGQLGWLDVLAIERLYGTTNPNTWSWDAGRGELTQVGGAGQDMLYGTGQRDLMRGGAGDDRLGGFRGDDELDGGAGADTLIGSLGNDIYTVDDPGDAIFEWSGEGIDHVRSSVGFTLDDNLENLSLTGTRNIDGTGSRLDNVIVGNAGDNLLDGGGGNDTIFGGAGFDTVRFSGNRADYAMTLELGGLQVSGRRGDSSVALLDDVEQARFADGDVLLAPLFTTELEAKGSTHLTQVVNHYFLSTANDDEGPQLSYQGANVHLDTFAGWAPISAEASGAGYLVAWKEAATSRYAAWNTDGTGAYVGQALGLVSGESHALQVLEGAFADDLNGDGLIGAPRTTLEAFGDTSLVAEGGQYLLVDSQGREVTLEYQGAAVVGGQFDDWRPISAEADGTGYGVAWQNGAADQYVVWSVDTRGRYRDTVLGVVPGRDPALQQAEAGFAHDLNGDGRMGTATTTLEAAGGTRLVQVADRFQLQDAQGRGPMLSYQGDPVVVGGLGPWQPIGAEATADGYQVAWQGAPNQFTFWAVGRNGAFTGNTLGVLAGSTHAFQARESAFGQDLNGDGVVGPKTTTVEASGATRLDRVADRFQLRDAQGAGPILAWQGSAVVAGQFGAWTPIAVERSGSGFQVAWKNGSADEYTVWTVTAAGAHSGNLLGVVGGTAQALQALEAGFAQDLNRDGVIGVAPFVVEALGETRLVRLGQHYVLQNAAGQGPILKLDGTPVTDGLLDAWRPIAAEPKGRGYKVVWRNGDGDEYRVWTADADGALSRPSGVVTPDKKLFQDTERAFQQDFNGDGLVGVKVVEDIGRSALVLDRGQFALFDRVTGQLLLLQDDTGGVTEADVAGLRPLGGERWLSRDVYTVVWQDAATGRYERWDIDADGRVWHSDSDVGRQAMPLVVAETILGQDLNADGVLGRIPSVLPPPDPYALGSDLGGMLATFGPTVGGIQGGAIDGPTTPGPAAGADESWRSALLAGGGGA